MFVSFLLFLPTKANALSGWDFKAGRIINDSVFYDSGSMDEGKIQQFLNAKVPNCDTWGTQPYGGTTRAAYASSKGVGTPFTCLKNYTQTVSTVVGNQYCSGTIPGGNKSSAGIIYDVAQACGVSPKVLLVLLQKEQSLVTDDWPWPVQYRSATGYGCPDTAPCDSEYYGFFNQVYQAAKAYKRYRANPANYNYRAGRNNTILWNPNAGCGTSDVYIDNQATAGLYIYTPYRPNQSALNNLYGTGDGCSSYGNRNFWRMYNDWFGNTLGKNFSAEYDSQSPYPVIDTGQSVTAFIKYKNTGSNFWKDDKSTFAGYSPTHLATTNSINRASMLAKNWTSVNRPASTFAAVYESDGTTLSADQHTVFPGQVAKFEFKIYANPSLPGGVYREYFQPIQEGSQEWDMGAWAYLDIGIHIPNYKATFHSQSGYPSIAKGSSDYAFVRYKNTGSDPWYDDESVFPGKTPIHLGTTWPINRGSRFTSSRPVLKFYKVLNPDGATLAPNQHVVQPGQIGEFVFSLNVPTNTPPGDYIEYYEVVAEGAPGNKYSIGQAAWLKITVL